MGSFVLEPSDRALVVNLHQQVHRSGCPASFVWSATSAVAIQLLTELALHTTDSTMCPPLLKSPLSSLESQILRVREYSRGAGLVLRPGGAAAARRQLALRTRQIQLIPAQTGAPGQTCKSLKTRAFGQTDMQNS